VADHQVDDFGDGIEFDVVVLRARQVQAAECLVSFGRSAKLGGGGLVAFTA
jgi:hypothetical protein